MATASDLADFLAREIPVYGAISRVQAERMLIRRGGVTPHQVTHAIQVAIFRGQISAAHGGTTLSRSAPQ